MTVHLATPTLSLFQENWWLDAVAPGRWEAVTVERGGKLVARMPFVRESVLGASISRMPPLTQTLGPWIATGEGTPAARHAGQLDLMTALIDKLPRFDWFFQNLHFSLESALPFYWKEFGLSCGYTYVIEDLEAASDLAFFRSHIRTDIKKAQRGLIVRSDLGIERFIAVNSLSFKRQGIRLPYSPAVLSRVYEAARAKDAIALYFAEDAKSRVHAAALVVHDSRAAYYLLGGADPELRHSGAQSLLVWSAIREAAGRSRYFDFEGSMNRNIGHFFRGFGALPRAYVRVERATLRAAPVLLARAVRASARRLISWRKSRTPLH